MTHAQFPCDLHTHSMHSDGTDSYSQLIDLAVSRGLRVLAITDHDVRPLTMVETATGPFALKDYAKARQICVLPGIEFSCNTEVEDVHIVALGCDFDDPRFLLEEENAAESKIESYRELCQRLTKKGMPIHWEEVLSARGVRIAEKEVQKKAIFELLAAKGFAPTWGQAKLMVKHDPELAIKRQKPAAEAVIQLIKATGGISILAHPYLIDEPVLEKNSRLTRKQYIEMLIKAGLDGIEGSYTYDKTSYKGHLTPNEIEAEIRADYQSRLPLISGGSDYHGDGKKGVLDPRMVGEKGLTMEYVANHPLLQPLLY